jgi:hypothetical protein
MQREISCRHCGKRFMPFIGKPGFIDECPPCLEERRPKPEPILQAHAVKPRAKRPMSVRSFNRTLLDMVRFIAELERRRP